MGKHQLLPSQFHSAESIALVDSVFNGIGFVCPDFPTRLKFRLWDSPEVERVSEKTDGSVLMKPIVFSPFYQAWFSSQGLWVQPEDVAESKAKACEVFQEQRDLWMLCNPEIRYCRLTDGGPGEMIIGAFRDAEFLGVIEHGAIVKPRRDVAFTGKLIWVTESVPPRSVFFKQGRGISTDIWEELYGNPWSAATQDF